MFGKKKTKSNYYFDSFPALCHFSVQCAEYVLNFMFADKLKTLREERGLSQSQLADKLFVTRQAVSKWERDAGMPDIPSLQKIADFFHEKRRLCLKGFLSL